MSEITEALMRLFAENKVGCTEQQAQQMTDYLLLLKEWSGKMNLTTILEENEMMVKHYLDSALLLQAIASEETAQPLLNSSLNWIDVGTGAGFPGMVVKLLRPGDTMTLLDSLQKRLTFLQEVAKRIGVDVSLLHQRAEDAGREQGLRMQFDVATARAVAPLYRLCEYCLPFVKMGGIFAAMKGPKGEEELEEARKAIRVLGGKVRKVCAYRLPDGDERRVVLIQRVAPLNRLYPRPAAKIKKEPLL